MNRSPVIRSAGYVCPSLTKGVAQEQAKQMMGAANPLTGKRNRAPASTFCPRCNAYHRSGNLCTKGLEYPTLSKGSKIVPTRSGTGNPNHDTSTGQFTAHPEGSAERKSQTRFRGKSSKVPSLDEMLSHADGPADNKTQQLSSSDISPAHGDDPTQQLSSSDLKSHGSEGPPGDGTNPGRPHNVGGNAGEAPAVPGARPSFQRPPRGPKREDHTQAAFDQAVSAGKSPNDARLAAGISPRLLGPDSSKVPPPSSMGASANPEPTGTEPSTSASSAPQSSSPTEPPPGSPPTPSPTPSTQDPNSTTQTPPTRGGARGQFVNAYGQGQSIGGGALGQVGGGVAPTANLAVRQVHGLLNRPSQPTRVGSQVVPRQQQLQQGSTHVAGQQQAHQQALQNWHPGTQQ